MAEFTFHHGGVSVPSRWTVGEEPPVRERGKNKPELPAA